MPAVAGDPENPLIFYLGTEGGGVWKTYDAGRYWQNVSDPYFKTASIGAIAVAPSDPNVIYVGTGETSQHVDIQAGDGVYKSTDGGHDLGECGAGGHAPHRNNHRLAARPESGVRGGVRPRIRDQSRPGCVSVARMAARSWQKILYVSDRAGAVDLSMDPSNPQVIYAAIWQFVRKPWSESSGGPDSGSLQDDRRRRSLDEHQPQPGFSHGDPRENRRV